MASDGSDGRDRRERRSAYTAKTRSDGGRAARLAPGVDCCGSAIHSAVDGRSSMAAKRLEARSNHGNDGGNFFFLVFFKRARQPCATRSDVGDAIRALLGMTFRVLAPPAA